MPEPSGLEQAKNLDRYRLECDALDREILDLDRQIEVLAGKKGEAENKRKLLFQQAQHDGIDLSDLKTWEGANDTPPGEKVM